MPRRLKPAFLYAGQRFPSPQSPRKRRRVHQEKAQRPVSRPSNSYPRSRTHRPEFFDQLRRRRISSYPQFRLRIAQISSVERAIDSQRRTEFARSARQILHCDHFPPRFHSRDAKLRFDGANQNRFGNARWPADDVDAKMESINQVDVSMSGPAPHRPVPWRLSNERVARRIIRDVSFRFHDRPAARSSRSIADEIMPEQNRSDLISGRLKKLTREK